MLGMGRSGWIGQGVWALIAAFSLTVLIGMTAPIPVQADDLPSSAVQAVSEAETGVASDRCRCPSRTTGACAPMPCGAAIVPAALFVTFHGSGRPQMDLDPLHRSLSPHPEPHPPRTRHLD